MAESEGVKNPLGSIPKEKRVYVYLGIGAAGIVAYAWWRNGKTASAASETAMDNAYADDGYVTQATGGDFWSGGAAGSSASSNDSSSETSGGMPLMKTNAEWVQYATEILSAAGTDPTAVQSALGKYLDRQALTAAEQDYVRRALAAAGPPPVGTYVVTPAIESPEPSKLAAPTGLKASKTTATTVDLTWNKVTGAGNYRVYRNGVAQNVGASFDTTAQIGGLEPDHSYTFTVAAGQANSEKVGPRSAPITVRTSKPKIGKPSTPRASEITKSSVYLTWNKVAGADGYRVYVDGFTKEPIGHSVDTKYRMAGIQPGKTYKFAVAAMVGGTTGPKSGWVTVTTKKK